MQQSIDRRGMEKSDETAIKLPGMKRRMIIIAVLSALLVVVYMTPVSAQEVAGKDLGVFYQQNCAKCHGLDGSAVDAAGKKLSGRNLTDPDWLTGSSGKVLKKAKNDTSETSPNGTFKWRH